MRLIDGDAFRRELDNYWPFTRDEQSKHDIANAAKSVVLIVLNKMPTIEERKKGEWIVISEFEDCRYVKCNQCKVTQVFYHNKPLTNFCPNCGADMRGEQYG